MSDLKSLKKEGKMEMQTLYPYRDKLSGEFFTEKNFLEIADKHLAPNYDPPRKIFVKGEGLVVIDLTGNSFYDLNACYSALPLGHIKGDLDIFPRAFHAPDRILFAKELAEFCGTDMVLPMNTGAEAVETAIKLARKWGYLIKNIKQDCAEVIVCENNFHGRTTTIVGFSSNPQYKQLFGPPTPGFKLIKFNNVKQLDEAITMNTVAFLVEPIQGEGGIIIPSHGYLQDIKDICRKRDILLILDEIQTGFGRTGKKFACDYENIKPDALILGKALGGGIDDISAVVSSEQIMGLFKPGDHGSTFGGNPKACRSARKFLKTFEALFLAENSAKHGEYFLKKLKEWSADKKSVKEVRGRGLFIGIEFKENFNAKTAAEMLLHAGLLTVIAQNNVLRLSPPLTIQQRDIDFVMNKFRQVKIP